MSEPMSAGWPGPQPDTAAERAEEAAPERAQEAAPERAQEAVFEPLPGAGVAPGPAGVAPGPAGVAPGPEAVPYTVTGGVGTTYPGPGTGREEAPEPVSEGVPEEAPEPVPEPVPEPPGPAAPAPLGVDRAPTGVPEVDTRLDRLADADHLETSGHLAVYEDVHGGLRDTLTALDRRPGPPAPGPRPPSAT